jgi:zinc protease
MWDEVDPAIDALIAQHRWIGEQWYAAFGPRPSVIDSPPPSVPTAEVRMYTWLAAAMAAPQPRAQLDLPGYTLDATTLCFPSGLQIHAVRREGASVVSVAAVVHGGTSGEDPGGRGAAHLLEHLWFESRPDGGATVRQVLSALQYQGFTLPDATVYVTTGSPEDLQPLLNIEAIRLLDPLAGVDEPTVVLHRQVVHSEWVWRGAGERDPVLAALEPTWFPDDERWFGQRSETLAQVDALTLAPLQAYAARWYRPEHVTIRVEGAVMPKELEAAVAKTFPRALLEGSAASCARTSVFEAPPEPTSIALQSVETPLRDPTLYFGWTLPPGHGPTDAFGRTAATMLAAALRDDLGRVRKMDPDDVDLDCQYEPG